MRIISKFHDYYDTAQAYGLDRSILYLRETRQIEPKRPNHYRHEELNPFFVGFCGKVYAGVFYSYTDASYMKTMYHCFYSLDKVNEYIESHRQLVRRYHYLNYTDKTFKKHFGENLNNQEAQVEKLFFEYNAPIYVQDVYMRTTTINPCLKDWEFFKVMDPFTTYMEISMYVGGVLLSNTKPIPVISDDDMRDAKGFDKWSFRKEPSSNKKR